MTRKLRLLTAILCAAALIAGSIESATAESQFKLIKIVGDCQVKLPDAKDFSAAKEGNAYPYGTTVKTGRKSSVVISFSEGNECRLLARTALTVSEDIKDKKMKSVRLAEGKVEVELLPEFHKDNSLQVETATAICGAVQCHFQVEVRRNLNREIVSLFGILEGIVKIQGRNFAVPNMSDGAFLQVTGTEGQDRVQLAVLKGTLKVQIGTGELMDMPMGTRIQVQPDPATGKMDVQIRKPDGTGRSITFDKAGKVLLSTTSVSSTTTTSTTVPTTTTTFTGALGSETTAPAGTAPQPTAVTTRPPASVTPTPVGNL